ncbi:MAG: hypothetical protein K0R73_1004 [Candidatus Midichloriaceae bacterium]|jgi:ankyrin repeat protein|nr:hypothetical protein [Candidatus Midichloriaceae bacterium]
MYNDQNPIDTKFQLLLEALNKKDLKTIKLALEAEFNQSYANQLLIEAINKKSYKAVELILKLGADPNASIQPYLSTALNYAIRARYIKIVKVLIKHGADIHKSYHPLGDPMQNPKMLKFYLSLGANITLRFAHYDELDYIIDDFPLCAATFHNRIRNLKFLIKHLGSRSLEERKIMLSQALLVAVHLGNYKALRCLIKAGADPNFSDINGSALMWAFVRIYSYGFSRNSLGLLELLATKGAKFTKDEQKFGKIKTAKCTKCTQNVRKTRLSKIDKYSKFYHESHWIIEEFENSDLIEENFLIIAVKANVIKTVKSLLEQGFDPNMLSNQGIPVAMIAIRENNFAALGELMKHGASFEQLFDFDKQFICDLISNEKVEILELILRYWPDCLSRHFILKEFNTKEVIDLSVIHDISLYDLGKSPTFIGLKANKPVHSLPPLLHAIYGKKTNLLELFLKNGANPNIVAEAGCIGLIECTKAKYVEGIDLLLKYGADINIKDECGNTALIWASYLNLTDVVIKLLKAGADINAKNKNGEDSLYWGYQGGSAKTHDLLIDWKLSFTHSRMHLMDVVTIN